MDSVGFELLIRCSIGIGCGIYSAWIFRLETLLIVRQRFLERNGFGISTAYVSRNLRFVSMC